MGYKLSVQQRQYNRTGWHKSSQFSSTDIKDIKVDRAVSDKSLNAIPSPFARIHLFVTAFDLLDKDELNSTDFAGDAYKRLVSDCFDVFELLFNWNTHIKGGRNLQITIWDKEKELALLRGGPSRKHKLLAESIQVFADQDVFDTVDEILIIKVDNQVIAGSSPFTGFFTSPNDIAKINLHNPISKRNYFTHVIPFADRKPIIRKYIYDFFFSDANSQRAAFGTVQNYLHKYNSIIDQQLNLRLEVLRPNGHQPIRLGNTTLYTNAARTAVDYFQDHIIRTSYRIGDENFVVPQNTNTERNHDYLLPFTPTFFQDFDLASMPALISIKEQDEKSVEVLIDAVDGPFIKKYHLRKLSEQEGQIIEMDQIKLNIGIFPFLRIEASSDIDYNDFYKIALVFQDNSYLYDNSDFHLSFGRGGELIEENGNVFNVKKEHRTLFARDKANIGSTYFSLNAGFDYILITIPNGTGARVQNAIVPKWPTKKLGSNRIDYSIDFGTTTTFISYTDDPEHRREPKRFELNENEVPVQFLNKRLVKRPQYNWIDCYERSLESFPECSLVQRQEFIPSILRSNEKYGLPLRSVLYQKKNIDEGRKSLFSNTNISFTYQKENNYATEHDQQFVSNLKWNIETRENYKRDIELFLEELFRLIRLKTLLLDGDPRKSHISWFSPLSFTSAAKTAYSTIWKELFRKVIKAEDTSQLRNITESEAPFYYLFKKATINDSSAVLTLDIGGGSTDLMYFTNNSPVLGSSVNFGANILWGSGYNDFSTDKSNGIFKSIKQTIGARLRTDELNVLNEAFVSESSPFGSDEIINFWIINEEKTKVSSELAKNDFKLSYLLHLSAILFHSFKLLNLHAKVAPSAIIFSGNGSRYIDLIQSEAFIAKICNYFACKVFGEQNVNVQVILPPTNRKEATCFGGLYHPKDQFSSFEQRYFLGLESDKSDRLKYSDIDVKKPNVFSTIDETFGEFITAFFEMNEALGLNFRTEFGVNQKLGPVKAYILANAKNFLQLGYDRRRLKVDGDDPATDSLFFYPLIGLLYKLNTVSDEELEIYKPKLVLYGSGPTAHGEFEAEKLKTTRQQDSIFLLELESPTDDIGEISIINDPIVHKRAITLITDYLKPVCEFVYPTHANHSINVKKRGEVRRTRIGWEVTQKMQIEFV